MCKLQGFERLVKFTLKERPSPLWIAKNISVLLDRNIVALLLYCCFFIDGVTPSSYLAIYFPK